MSDDLTPAVRDAIVTTAQTIAAEFARQMGRYQLDALPLDVLAHMHDIPPSTLDAVRRKDRGPRVFNIGRRVYCLREDWQAWLRSLAEAGGTGALNAPRRSHKTPAGVEVIGGNGRAECSSHRG